MNNIKKSFNRFSKAGRLLILFTAAAVVCGIGAVIAQVLALNLFNWNSTVYREEYSLPFKSYLHINVTNIPLYIETYGGDEIKIFYNNETALMIEENEYSYTFSQDADFAFSFYSLDFLEYSMRILLPDKIYREITITSASGNVEILNTEILRLDISCRSGNINITEAAGNVHLKTLYGNINAKFTDYSDNCVLESDTGGISISMPAECLIWLEFLTDSGSFTSDFFKKEYENRKGSFFMANGENAEKLSVTTKSGDLKLEKQQSS